MHLILGGIYAYLAVLVARYWNSFACPQQEHMKFKEIDIAESWNPDAKIPVHLWLQSCQTEEDAKRLKTMGNIVVPFQAVKALGLLVKMEAVADHA